MAWRNPRFAYLHAARDVGVASITPDTTFTSGDEAYLIDDRPSVQFAWSDSVANHDIVIDLGATPQTGIDRLWIPNHNITSNYTVEEDDNSGFTTPTTLKSGSMTSGTDLDVAITASSERYLRVTFASAGAWALGQLYYSTTVTLTAGPESGWTDELIPSVLQLPSGDTIQTRADRRAFEFTWPYAGDAAAADLTNLEALVTAVSTFRPFLLDPPYDTESVHHVRFAERPRKRINTLVSNGGTRTAEIVLSMIEYLG